MSYRKHRETGENSHRIGLLGKCVYEHAQKLVGVFNLISIFADDPNKRRLCLWLIQFV
jgi:hypothetical protein